MAGGALSPATHSAEEVIRLLGLAPLPGEGGFFRRTMASESFVPGTQRRSCSAILFLLTPESFSALHTVDADETWCFHVGDAVELITLTSEGEARGVRLGLAVGEGETPQFTVPAGQWQGACLAGAGRWALVSCVVARSIAIRGSCSEGGPICWGVFRGRRARLSD